MKQNGCLLCLILLVPALASAEPRIALQVDAPVAALGTNWPMYCGVPFPRATLRDPLRTRVVDGQGRMVSRQARAMARWTGSDDIRWLGVDFLGDPSKSYFLEFGPDLPGLDQTGGAPGILLERKDGAVIVTTGPARFMTSAAGPLIARAWLDLNRDGRFGEDELILHADQGELYVTDQAGRTAVNGADAAEPDMLTLEPEIEELRAQGAPLHVAIRREGWYTTGPDQERLARHITRLHFYAGQSFVRIEHTLVLTRNTNPTAYLAKYNKKQPPIWFRDIGIRFQHALAGARAVTFAEDSERPDRVMRASLEPANRALFMFQEKAFYFSRMDPRADCRFVIGRETASGTAVLKEGARCGDWVDAAGTRAGVTLSVRNLWQQYPKELNVTSNAITARLWSSRGGRELDFRLETMLKQWPTNWLNHELHGDYGDAYNSLMTKGSNFYALGLAKTHEMLLYLHPGAAGTPAAAPVVEAFSRPVAVLADPKWLYKTEAMSPIYPRDTNQFPLAEAFMENYFDSYMKIIRSWGDYGFIEYGSGPHVWYRVGKKGQSLEGRWFPYLYRYSGIIDYGFHTHLWRMYARSGQRKYLDYAEETNRQRMDINMIHWDGPGVNYSKVNSWMIGKYRGAFSCPSGFINWTPYSVLHHNSGTELRHLYWFYYLRDYRRAHDVAEDYRTLVKRLWNEGGHSPFIGTRPFATLKNLGTLYQETGDPKILEIGRERLAALVDLESPQGVTPKLATGLGKYTTNIGAVERWYEATGDELAKKSLLRGAGTYARTSMGNLPFTYYNVFARVLNRAYRITGDALYARTLQRDMDLAVAIYYDAATGQWKNMFDNAASAAGSPYPLGDMAIGMDAITRVGDALDPTPLLQTGQGRPVLAIFHKPAKREIMLDVRSHVPLRPRVLTLSGETVTGVLYEPFRDALYNLKKSDHPRFYYVRLPATIPESDYVLDPGLGGAPWEVTWTDASNIVAYAPGGVSDGCGRAWVSRFSPGATPETAPATWRFMVPKETRQFEIYCSAAIDLRAPDGKPVAVAATQQWFTVSVPPEQAGKLWRFRIPQAAFVELRGVPPLLGSGRDKLFFLPDTTRLPVAAFGLERDYRFASEPVIPSNARYVTGAPLGKEALQGLALRGTRVLRVPRGERLGEGRFQNFNCQEGTLEFWFLPDWSSVYQIGNAAEKTVLIAGHWSIVLQHKGLLSGNMRVPGAKGASALESSFGLTLERGRWTHLAWQWHAADGQFMIEAYVNGKLENTARADKGWKPSDPGEFLHFSHPRSSLNGVAARLRLSGARRYATDFTPTPEIPPGADTNTLALFLFDQNVNGVSGAGRIVAATIAE